MKLVSIACLMLVCLGLSPIHPQLIFQDNLRKSSTQDNLRKPSTQDNLRKPSTQDSPSNCRTPSGLSGQCIGIRKCPSLLTHAKRKNVQHLRQSVCGQQGRIRNLCCPDHINSSGHGSSSNRPSSHNGTSFSSRPSGAFRSPDDCGISPLEPGRIVGGEPVQYPGQFPWQAALSYDSTNTPFQCGGALINSRWILTAAHCILDNGPKFARLGDINFNTVIDDDPQHPPQHIAIQEAIVHEGYKRRVKFPKGMDNDIALLKLSESAKLSDVVRPICLPEKMRPISQLEKKQAVIAGWGSTEYGGRGTSVMMWARVNVSDHSQCRRNYHQAGVVVDDQSQLCASGNDYSASRPDCLPEEATELRCQGGVDSCRGDSGGPLIMSRQYLNRYRWYCEGVVSFAIGCGSPFYPGIYTKVDSYLDWISQHVQS